MPFLITEMRLRLAYFCFLLALKSPFTSFPVIAVPLFCDSLKRYRDATYAFSLV